MSTQQAKLEWSRRWASRWVKGANKSPGIHGANSRLPREEPRNKRRDILRMRAEFYDHRLTIEAVVERWRAVGYEEDEIRDVVFYRAYRWLWFSRESECVGD